LYKRILLAYDGSVKGRAALREGALVAKYAGAKVFLLSVIAEAPGSRLADGAGGSSASHQHEDYKAVLRDGVRRLQQLGFEPEAKLVIGEPAREIGAFADRIGADLVVVGHQRQSAFERWWSGPSGAYLIDHLHCSMLVSLNVLSDEAFATEMSTARPLAAVAEPTSMRHPEGTPQTHAEGLPQPEAVPPPGVRRKRFSRQRLRWVLYAAVPLALVGALIWYAMGGRVVTMTDAYVEADKVGISTDVPGIVKEVAVVDNQYVQAGQLLYRLDDQPFMIALQRAEAQIGITRQSLNALKSNYRDTQAQLVQAQEDVAYYTREFRRTQNLLQAHVASQSAYDTAHRNLESARQKLISLRQQLAGVAANLNGDPAGPVEQNPRYLDALAQRDEAARQLAHTVVKAPFTGTVTNVPDIAPGRYLPVSAIAFYLVATDHVWVDANPKETQLTYVRPAQPASVTVDTYPGVKWPGTVESISPAAAQEFSLLPAQNTSGNWVKVVQRIPMRIRVDTRDRSRPPLRAGMSVEVAVDTGHSRGLPFLTARSGP
jgi:membrane fusion protein, multidrug efflux system